MTVRLRKPEPAPDPASLPRHLAQLQADGVARLQRRRRGQWVVLFLLMSLLLHSLVTLLLVREDAGRPRPEPRAESPMTFELSELPTVTPPTPEPEVAAPKAETPVPEETRPPQAPKEPPQPEPAEPPKPPEPVQPPPPEPPPAPAPPAPTPPDPQPPEPAPPVTLEPAPPLPPPPQPQTPPPAAPAARPVVPPPRPVPPRPAPPRPAPPRPASPPPAQDSADFFIPPRLSGAGGPGRGPVNLSLGRVDQFKADPPRRNANDRVSDLKISGAQLGSDWERDLMANWIEHRFYPPEAGQRGQSGQVRVVMKVERSGRVSSVTVTQSSGWPMIDAAALGTWRGARLSPFPVNTPENSAEITLDLYYILYR